MPFGDPAPVREQVAVIEPCFQGLDSKFGIADLPVETREKFVRRQCKYFLANGLFVSPKL